MRKTLKSVQVAFTLLELIVVTAAVGVLIALVLSAVQRVRAAADRARCSNNLRQISIGLHNYHDTYSILPPGHAKPDGTDPYPFLGWQARILSFLERNNEWKDVPSAYQTDRYPFHNPPHLNLSRVVDVYMCPSDPRTRSAVEVRGSTVALTSFVGVEGKNQFDHSGVLFNLHFPKKPLMER